MRDHVARDLVALLRVERRAILAAEFQALAGLTKSKAELLAALAQDVRDTRILHLIGEEIARNQTLLATAIAGVRDASLRLAALRRIEDGFSTYDSQGQKAMVGGGRPAVERKA